MEQGGVNGLPRGVLYCKNAEMEECTSDNHRSFWDEKGDVVVPPPWAYKGGPEPRNATGCGGDIAAHFG